MSVNELGWDGEKTVSMVPEGTFFCGECARPMSFVPFGDVVHGGPQRVFYCEGCKAIVDPEVAQEKVQGAIGWLMQVVQLLQPTDLDPEVVPPEKNPYIDAGLVDAQGQKTSTDKMARVLKPEDYDA